MSFADALDSYFGITKLGSNFKREIKAGIVTFLAVVYILVSNPAILNASGTLNSDALFTSTAVAAIIGCIATGLFTKFPMVMATGMGINAFISYTIMSFMGFTYAQALMAVLISGILFIVVSVTHLRMKIIESVPASFRISITIGIGLFISVMGAVDAGIFSIDTGVPTLGNLAEPSVALGIFCVLATFFIFFKNPMMGVIGGILVTVVVGIVFGIIPLPDSIVSIPNYEYIGYVFTGFEMFDTALIPSFIVAVFALLIVDIFDSAGTLLGVLQSTGMDEDKEFKDKMSKVLVVDSVATVVGAGIGTSTVTSFVESEVGIESGGRTGLMTIIVGLLFAVALFFYPIFSVVSSSCIVGALIFVGVHMMFSIKDFEWTDNVSVATLFVTMSTILMSYSISNGIGFGSIVYVLGMISTGRYKEIPNGMKLIAGLFIVYFLVYYLVMPSM